VTGYIPPELGTAVVLTIFKGEEINICTTTEV